MAAAAFIFPAASQLWAQQILSTVAAGGSTLTNTTAGLLQDRRFSFPLQRLWM